MFILDVLTVQSYAIIRYSTMCAGEQCHLLAVLSVPYSSEFHRVSGWSTVNSPWLLPCCCDSLAGDTSAANGSQRPTSPPLITPVTPLRILRPSQKTSNGLFGYSLYCVPLQQRRIILPRPLNQLSYKVQYMCVLGLPYCLFMADCNRHFPSVFGQVLLSK